MIDNFALVVSHGMLVILVLRLLKAWDPELPPKKMPLPKPTLSRPQRRPRA